MYFWLLVDNIEQYGSTHCNLESFSLRNFKTWYITYQLRGCFWSMSLLVCDNHRKCLHFTNVFLLIRKECNFALTNKLIR